MEKLTIMNKIGFLCYALAAIDLFLTYILDIDYTGVWWSPLVIGLIGAFLLRNVD